MRIHTKIGVPPMDLFDFLLNSCFFYLFRFLLSTILW